MNRRDTRFGLRMPLWLPLALAIIMMASLAQAAQQAKYVFFFIGDGMAQVQRSAAEYHLAAERGLDRPGIVRLVMNELPVQGATTTYSLNSIITDSGAAGTALACGVKSYNGAIAVDGQKNPVRSMAEMAKDKGMKVGIISSVSLDHATPASFYAHQASRNNYYEIALDMAKSNFDLFAGGGLKDPTGKKSKMEGTKVDAIANLKDKGYAVVDTREAIMSLKPGKKAVAFSPNLDADKAMPYAIDNTPQDVTLAEFTGKAIDLLNNPKGFFLMVEGGKIDWACHANDAMSAIMDTLAFDQSIAKAVAFAKKHPKETLIVVTGDHECGGMALGFAGTKYGNYYAYLKNQKMSFESFTSLIKAYKKDHTAQNAKLEDLLPVIRANFGLIMPTAADKEAMKGSPKPNEEITSPADNYGMYLKDYEIKEIQDAFNRTMAGEQDGSKDPVEYLRYGGYEPLAVAVTHILNNKAGIAWTTYSHTGMPVITSALGVNASAFAGYYDNTDLSHRIMSVIGGGQKQVAAR